MHANRSISEILPWLVNETGPYDNASSNFSTFQFIPELKQPVHMIVIYSAAYLVIFLLGLLGNTLVVLVVYRNVRMHNVTNYFIVNLAVADILVCLLCLPISLLQNLYAGWRWGAVMCKAAPFLQGVAVSASISTLTAISLDRYLAICYTLEYRMTRSVARIIIISIWLAACALMSPWLVYYRQGQFTNGVQQITTCELAWPSQDAERAFFLGAIILVCYTLPLILISVCYTLLACRVWNRQAPGIANTSQVIYQSKIKVVKMLVVVVILFAFSWLPLYAISVRILFGPEISPDSVQFMLITQVLIPVAQWLGLSNSCVNPIIYCFFSKKFRHGFQQMMHCCKTAHYYGNRQSTVYHSVNNGSSQLSNLKPSLKPRQCIRKQHKEKEGVSFV